MEAPSLSLVFRLPHERLLGQRRDESPLNLTYHTFNKLQRIEGEAYVIEPRTPLYIENQRRVFSAETGIHTPAYLYGTGVYGGGTFVHRITEKSSSRKPAVAKVATHRILTQVDEYPVQIRLPKEERTGRLIRVIHTLYEYAESCSNSAGA